MIRNHRFKPKRIDQYFGRKRLRLPQNRTDLGNLFFKSLK